MKENNKKSSQLPSSQDQSTTHKSPKDSSIVMLNLNLTLDGAHWYIYDDHIKRYVPADVRLAGNFTKFMLEALNFQPGQYLISIKNGIANVHRHACTVEKLNSIVEEVLRNELHIEI